MGSLRPWCLAVAAGIALAAAAHADVRLDGRTAVVIRADGPAREELSLAADLLAKYLLLTLDRKTLDGDGPAARFELNASAVSWEQLAPNDLSGLNDLDAFEIEVADAPKAVIRIRGATVLAVSFGVMHFLETRLGVTWLFPGDLGLALPREKTFALRPGKEARQPAMVSRIFSGMQYQDPEAMAAFRQKYAKTPLMQHRGFFSGYDYYKSLKLHGILVVHHNMINIFPVKGSKQVRPDIFPIRDGKPFSPPEDPKTPGHHAWHPCYSQPKTLETAIERTRQAFGQGALCYSLGINDGLRVQCQCAECRQAGWPGAYYRFVARVAEAARDAYPPRMVGVLVYGDVRRPQPDLRLPENVYAVVTTGSRLSDWSRHASHLGTYAYFYGSGFVVPSFPLKAMQWNARQHLRHKVKGFYAETYPVWAFDAPKVYLQSRLFWEPDLDAEAALDRFCAAAYGAGGAAMARLFRLWASKWDYLVDERSEDPAPLCDMKRWRNSSVQFDGLNAADFQTSADLFRQARQARPADKESLRLDMVETYLNLGWALFRLDSTVQQVFAAADGADLGPVFASLQADRQAVAQAEATISAHPEWSLAAGSSRPSGAWSLDKETHSAAITAVLKRREQAALKPEGLAEDLRAFAGPLTEAAPVRMEVLEKGTYYATPQAEGRFQPMTMETREGAFQATTQPENPRIAEGSQAGQYRQHWAAFSFVRKPGQGRALFRVEIEAEARQGALDFSLQNNWRPGPRDGLPVNTGAAFDAATRRVVRSFYVEPILPGSEYEGKPSSHKGFVVWTPIADDAACRVVVRLAQARAAAVTGR